MTEFLISALLAAGFVLMAERCRRNPEKCKDGFMLKNGWTRSLFALRYLGRAGEARQAIVQDVKLRQKFLIELYVWAFVLLLLGISRLFSA